MPLFRLTRSWLRDGPFYCNIPIKDGRRDPLVLCIYEEMSLFNTPEPSPLPSAYSAARATSPVAPPAARARACRCPRKSPTGIVVHTCNPLPMQRKNQQQHSCFFHLLTYLSFYLPYLTLASLSYPTLFLLVVLYRYVQQAPLRIQNPSPPSPGPSTYTSIPSSAPSPSPSHSYRWL